MTRLASRALGESFTSSDDSASVTRDMLRWSDIAGCPYCRGTVHQGDEHSLICRDCDKRFTIHDRIPSLIRRADVERLETFCRAYRDARWQDGWRPMRPEQALALPYGSPPGYPVLYWEVRRQTYKAFSRFLSGEGPFPGEGPVADLGAGTGWLAYRLVQAGYRVLAVEACLDEDFGIGASKVFWPASGDRFLPIQGNLDHPPLRPATLSLVVLNASLHYAQDLERTVRRVAEALRPSGCLAILDTPIARHPCPGTGRGDRHLGRQELEEAMVAAGLGPRWVSVRRGWRWWVHQMKTRLKRGQRFNFPIVLGRRETPMG